MNDFTGLTFEGKIWLFPGKAAWYFVTLPKECADQIRFYIPLKRGFGSVKVTATIGETSWNTSIFPDKKSGSYLLPLKAEVRKNEDLHTGQNISVNLKFHDSL